MPKDFYKYYKPHFQNQMEVQCLPINQSHVSGGGIRTDYIGQYGYVSGGAVSTRNVVVAYIVTVRYSGPDGNFGDRLIVQSQFPNYCLDKNVRGKAAIMSDINPDSGCCWSAYSNACIDCTYTMSKMCCLCGCFICICCIKVFREDYIEGNRLKFTGTLNNIADDHLSQAVVPLLQQADAQIGARLKFLQDQYHHHHQQMQQQSQLQHQAQSQQQSQAQQQAHLQQQVQQLVQSQQSMLVQMQQAGAAGPVGAGAYMKVDADQYRQFVQFQQFQQMQAQGQVQGQPQPIQVQQQAQMQSQAQSQPQSQSQAQSAAAAPSGQPGEYVPPPVVLAPAPAPAASAVGASAASAMVETIAPAAKPQPPAAPNRA